VYRLAPNPAEYEADRHRGRDFQNHHPSHGMFLCGSMPLGCPYKGYRTIFYAATSCPIPRQTTAAERAGVGECLIASGKPKYRDHHRKKKTAG
jgi:hypothetical protein